MRIYLDNNATTELDPAVKRTLIEEMERGPSNPSSPHFFGREAKLRLMSARKRLALFLKVRDEEITFTSGATEGMNLLLQGFCSGSPGCHILTSAIEHPSILKPLAFLEKRGAARVTYLPVDRRGHLRLEQIEESITPLTRLIVLSAVNSETGVKNPLHEIGKIAAKASIPLIVDAVALFGKELFIVDEAVRGLVISSHKCHGPKGVGAVWIHPSLKIDPLHLGGPQENMRRGGTENLLAIVGFEKAVEELGKVLPEATQKMFYLSTLLEEGLKKRITGVHINGEAPRVVNTLNVSFERIDGESLLINLDLAGIAVSHGSACSSGALEPSPVLTRMGIERPLVQSAIRFSISRFNTQEEIERTIEVTSELIEQMRAIALNYT